MKWTAIICGIVGGGIPFLLGAYLAGHEMVYSALHPTPPGIGACGMSMAMALFVIAVGTPLGAGVFAVVGWLIGGCATLWKRQGVELPAGVENKMDDNPYRSPVSKQEAGEPVRCHQRNLAIATSIWLFLAGMAGLVVLYLR